MNIERKSSFLILGASFLWALDLLVRYPLTLEMDYVVIVFLESLLGLLFVLPWQIKNLQLLKKVSLTDWLKVLFIGAGGMVLGGYLQSICIQKATPGLFSFFQIFQPLFVIFLARLVLKEFIDNLYIYWGSWAVISALLMFSVDLELMISSDFSPLEGGGAFLTMMIWGVCTILGKLFLQNHLPFLLVSLRWGMALIFSSIILSFRQEKVMWDLILIPENILRFLFIGLVSGTFSMWIYYKGLRSLPAGRVTFIEMSYAALGMIFSALYTFEALTFLQVIGALSFFSFIVLFIQRGEISRVEARPKAI